MTNKFLKSGNYDTIIKDYSIAITILILVQLMHFRNKLWFLEVNNISFQNCFLKRYDIEQKNSVFNSRLVDTLYSIISWLNFEPAIRHTSIRKRKERKINQRINTLRSMALVKVSLTTWKDPVALECSIRLFQCSQVSNEFDWPQTMSESLARDKAILIRW